MVLTISIAQHSEAEHSVAEQSVAIQSEQVLLLVQQSEAKILYNIS